MISETLLYEPEFCPRCGHNRVMETSAGLFAGVPLECTRCGLQGARRGALPRDQAICGDLGKVAELME